MDTNPVLVDLWWSDQAFMREVESMVMEMGLKYWPIIHGLATSVSPFIASQFDWSSAKYFDYETKKVFLNAYQDFVRQEITNLANLRHEIRQRLYEASSVEERLASKEKMRLISEEINQLTIYRKIPDYIDAAMEGDDQAPQPMSDVWIDRFNDLARRQSEEWRSDLMASAFANESASPGSVGLDVIHMIGTLDQASFYNFSALLQISFKLYELRCIPLIGGSVLGEDLVVEGKTQSVTTTLFKIEHVGLFSSGVDLGISLKSESLSQLRYGDEVLALKSDRARFYGALITTRLGASLAKLCALEPSHQGWELFNRAEEMFKRDGVLLKRWTL